MAKSYTPFRRSAGGRNPSVPIGAFAVTAALFLTLPLTQLIDPDEPPDGIDTGPDFALAAPVLDLVEPPSPVDIVDDRIDPTLDLPVEPIPLDGIAAILDGLTGGPGGRFSDGLIPNRLDEMIDTFDLADLDQAPVPVHRVAPNYPYDLKSAGIEGTVSLVFIVDEKGRVREVRVEGASHRGFVQPSVDALLQWKFEPGRLGDRFVRTRMMIPLQFKVR